MARRKKNSGKKAKKKMAHKEVIVPLEAYRVRYPDYSEEWSPVVISALRIKQVKDPKGDRFRWSVLPANSISKQIHLKSKEDFDAWKTTFSFTSN